MVRRNLFSLCRQPVQEYRLGDITDRVLKIIFQEIPEDSIRFRHLVIFGQPESGKTTMLRKLAEIAVMTYEPQDQLIGFRYLFGANSEQVNIIAGYRLGDLLPHINDKPVQLLIIDDAARGAHSRRGMGDEVVEDIRDFYEIRHIFERKRKNGVIIVAWSIQRFKTLDITFRNGHVLLFKTAGADPGDESEIRGFVGDDGYDGLRAISRDIYEKAKDNMKSITIARISWDQQDDTGYIRTGLPMHDYIKWIIPSAVEGKDPGELASIVVEDFDWEEAVYEQLKRRYKQKFGKWIKLWYMTQVLGKTPRVHMSDFEATLGRKKSWIYTNIKEMNKSPRFQGIIAEIRGKLFEGFLYQKLINILGSENVQYNQGAGGHTDFTITNASIREKAIEKGTHAIALNAKAGAPGTSYSKQKFDPEISKLQEGRVDSAYIVFYDITAKTMRLKEITPKTTVISF